MDFLKAKHSEKLNLQYFLSSDACQDFKILQNE